MFDLLTVTPIDVSSYVEDVMSTITELVTPVQMVAVVGAIVGASLVFVFLWWGVRKGFNAIMSAIQHGRAQL